MIEEELFQHIHDTKGNYEPHAHIAETISLLGPPPKSLVKKHHARMRHKWPAPITRADGQVCHTAEEYFGGPFFDKDSMY